MKQKANSKFASLIQAILISIFTFLFPFVLNAQDGDVVKITTNLIRIDVVVTDKKGQQVTGLKAEDFELTENGTPQTITNLSYVSAPELAKNEKQSKKVEAKSGLEIPVVQNELNESQVRRTYALIVDDLGVSFSSMFGIKAALKKFIDEQMQPGDLVALVRTGGGVGALQAFTSDKAKLLSTVNSLKWNPRSRGTFNLADFSNSENYGSDYSTVSRNSNTNQANDFYSTLNSIDGSIGAIIGTIQGMKDLPGRKSVILFSEGYTVGVNSNTIPPSARLENESSNSNIFRLLRIVTELANRESVVIYTIDPIGLTVPGFIPASSSVSASSRIFEAAANDSNKMNSGLAFLAKETGGLSYLNQNDMNTGLAKAINDQSYYLLEYEPQEDTFDPNVNKYNQLNVTLKRPDLKVRYRAGFSPFTNAALDSVSSPDATISRLKAAINSPFSVNSINIRTYSIVGNEPKTGDYINSLVRIDANDLEFKKTEDGKHLAKVQIVAFTMSVNGKIADFTHSNYEIKLNDAQYKSALENGLIYKVPVSVKKSGGYQMRLALVDLETGKIGSQADFISVPKIKKSEFWLSNLLIKNENIHPTGSQLDAVDALTASTMRKFKIPTRLQFGGTIYNAKIKNGKPNIEMKVRLIKDGKIVIESENFKADVGNQPDTKRLNFTSSIILGTNLAPADYLLQVIVRDKNQNKGKTSSQWIDFELVK